MPVEDPEKVPEVPEKAQESDKSQTAVPSPSVQQTEHEISATGRSLFRSLTRELSDSDMNNPGVQKMLLADNERLENDNANLKGYIERYHEADKRSAILEEKVRTNKSIDVICGAGMAIGGVIIGLSAKFWDSCGIFLLMTGMVLMAGSIGARIIKR